LGETVRSDERTSDLLAAAPDAMLVVGADGRIREINSRAEDLFGYPRPDIVWQPVDVLLPYPMGDHPVRGPQPAGGVFDLEGRRRDGTTFPAEVTAARSGDLVVVAVRDAGHLDRGHRRRVDPAQDLLASIVLSSHDAIISMTRDGEITSWNPGAEDLYGYPADEMLGRSIDLLFPRDGRADEREIMSLVAAGGRVERYRTRRLRRDGSTVMVSLTVSPLTDGEGEIVGLATTSRDISERERAEAKFQDLLESAPDAIVGVRQDGRVVLVNVRAEQMFGYPRHELIGQPIEILVPDVLRDAHVTLRNQYLGDPVPRPMGMGRPLAARRRDGTELPVEISLGSLHADDGLVVTAAIRDITERLQVQAEQQRLRAEAERERITAGMHRTQRLESLGQLAGGVAHDFNNLLAVILNYSAFITEEAGADSPDAGAIAGDSEQITRAAIRGSELTRQLLAFARREVARPRVLDLNQVIGDVEQMLRRLLGEHVLLSTRLAAAVPAVKADPGQLEQVLVNLAVNARDAMPGGGTLVIDTAPVTVDDDYAAHHTGIEPGRHVRIRVSDTGEGMPADVIDRAFEPFYTTKPSGEGTGLGLATVYGIVTQAGGTVTLYSEPGMGTTVQILLPVTEEEAGSAASPDRSPAGGRGETVLVVEDEDALRAVTGRILRSCGYRVLAAADGAAALDLVAHHDGPVDLLLTDVVMPGMLGKELAQRLAPIRVLYMSGYAQPVLASQGTLDPGVALLEKPFGRSELLSAVRERIDAGIDTGIDARTGGEGFPIDA
jgi:two-component system, cell cycle sensor histidine kinase and response regulator CckA